MPTPPRAITAGFPSSAARMSGWARPTAGHTPKRKEGHLPRRRVPLPLLAIVAAASVTAVVFGGGTIIQDQAAATRVATIREDVASDAAGEALLIDWDALAATCPAACAWVRVDATHIDQPVARAEGPEHMDFYLTHDAWGEPTEHGCPFLDYRSDPDAGIQVSYAHHFNGQTIGYSELYGCWEQSAFEGVGALHWSTPARGTLEMAPLCALRVDMEDMEAQTFDVASTTELREWLSSMCGRAEAIAPDWEERVSGATRAVELVTCSSSIPGQRTRTVVVFCS